MEGQVDKFFKYASQVTEGTWHFQMAHSGFAKPAGRGGSENSPGEC